MTQSRQALRGPWDALVTFPSCSSFRGPTVPMLQQMACWVVHPWVEILLMAELRLCSFSMLPTILQTASVITELIYGTEADAELNPRPLG